jgi:hypothetical protein
VIGPIPRIQVDYLDADAHLARSLQDAAAGHVTHQGNRSHNQYN